MTARLTWTAVPKVVWRCTGRAWSTSARETSASAKESSAGAATPGFAVVIRLVETDAKGGDERRIDAGRHHGTVRLTIDCRNGKKADNCWVSIVCV